MQMLILLIMIRLLTLITVVATIALNTPHIDILTEAEAPLPERQAPRLRALAPPEHQGQLNAHRNTAK